VGTETQNDVKKVAAVRTATYFTSKNKRYDISLSDLLELVSLRYLGKLLEYEPIPIDNMLLLYAHYKDRALIVAIKI
jgi:hypothetical protein